LSAKWRRTRKNPDRFSSIFRTSDKPRSKNIFQPLRVRDLRTKKHKYPYVSIEKIRGNKIINEPKPLIDIIEAKDEIVVVAEFAGFKEENLRTNVKRQRLTLSAEALDRKYYKSLNLPKRVIPETIRTTYKNGVLEIRLKKSAQEKAMNKVVG
jgi:HSP20 family molecular chaperone IbpA